MVRAADGIVNSVVISSAAMIDQFEGGPLWELIPPVDSYPTFLSPWHGRPSTLLCLSCVSCSLHASTSTIIPLHSTTVLMMPVCRSTALLSLSLFLLPLCLLGSHCIWLIHWSRCARTPRFKRFEFNKGMRVVCLWEIQWNHIRLSQLYVSTYFLYTSYISMSLGGENMTKYYKYFYDFIIIYVTL